MTRQATARQLWGGRFKEPPAPLFRQLNDSFPVDRELAAEEAACARAWTEALVEARVLDEAEGRRLSIAIDAIGAIAAGGIPDAAAQHEDVHTWLEAELAARVGPLADKLGTGRSRNDLVATELKLYLKKGLAEARAGALAIAETLAHQALVSYDVPLPGYTHGLLAEPVTLGHQLLAYAEMLVRDVARIDGAAARGDECPLGSGALAGTPLAIDRGRLARRLGFARPTGNSLDAVSDRDMAVDYLHAASLLLSHLSRLAADLMAASSDAVRFVELPDAYTSGSSRMPHKKNPDLLELTRGHAGRAAGDLAGLLALLKGLPLAYDKDLQLDKEPLFRMRALLAVLLPALDGLLAGLRWDHARMRTSAAAPELLATSRADALAASGVPFRLAHEQVGRAEGGGSDGAGSLHRALASKNVVGGTAPRRVRQAARSMVQKIGKLRRGDGRASKGGTS